MFEKESEQTRQEKLYSGPKVMNVALSETNVVLVNLCASSIQMKILGGCDCYFLGTVGFQVIRVNNLVQGVRSNNMKSELQNL